MEYFVSLGANAAKLTLLSLSHNWPYLLASIVIAGCLKAFVDTEKVSVFLNRFRRAGVLSAAAAAVATPLCSCGTTAVVLGMMASTMPWAPIVAFMVASPLSSPEGIVYSAGLFGWNFAIYYFVASIVLGLAGGAAAAVLQKTGFLDGQLRFAATQVSASPCCSSSFRADRQASQGLAVSARLSGAGPSSCGCVKGTVSASAESAAPRRNVPAIDSSRKFAAALWDTSKIVLPFFIGFAFFGYLLNGIIPASAIGTLFGAGRSYGVPLAATIALPLYLNSDASIPLARALLDSGMSPGAIMAFLIAGAGTSVGAIGGALTIARWKVVALVVAVLWIGAITVGYSYNALVGLGLL